MSPSLCPILPYPNNWRLAISVHSYRIHRRLDELTPVLAQKEALIARVEREKDDALSRLRAAQAENSQLQVSEQDDSMTPRQMLFFSYWSHDFYFRSYSHRQRNTSFGMRRR